MPSQCPADLTIMDDEEGEREVLQAALAGVGLQLGEKPLLRRNSMSDLTTSELNLNEGIESLPKLSVSCLHAEQRVRLIHLEACMHEFRAWRQILPCLGLLGVKGLLARRRSFEDADLAGPP